MIASGNTTLTVPLGSKATQTVSFPAPSSGSRVYLVLSTSKAGTTVFSDAVEYFTLGSSTSPAPGTYRIVNRNSGKPLAIDGNSIADGAKAVQQTGGGTWTLSTSGSAFTLRYHPTGKVLDVNGFSSTAGLQLQPSRKCDTSWIVPGCSGFAGCPLGEVGDHRKADHALGVGRRSSGILPARPESARTTAGTRRREPPCPCAEARQRQTSEACSGLSAGGAHQLSAAG